MTAVHDTAATATLRGHFPTRQAEVTPPSRREQVVFALSVAALILPVWLVGSWEVWAQKVTLALGIAAFAALWAPMLDFRAWPQSPSADKVWAKLKSFPIFWIGLAIMVYGIIAALNPSRILFVSEQNSWLEDVRHVSFLPHSVRTPFMPMNAWHALMIVAPAWLAVCAAWAGLETEQSWRHLLGIIAINGALLAVVGIAEAISGTSYLFWTFDVGAPEFFGSFIYAGHAAAWMALAFGAAAAMMDHRLRRRDPLVPPRRWGWPALMAWGWLAALLVMLLALGLFVRPDYWSLAAGGVLVIAAWLWLGRLWREGQKRRAALYALPALFFMGFMLLTAGGAIWLWHQGGQDKNLAVNPHDPALPLRYAFARTSAVMIKDEPWYGWGPGSFRYISPYYLPRNPQFRDPANTSVTRYGLHYALSDWVQITAEWGGLGAGLFVAGALWWAVRAWKLRALMPGESWLALSGVAMVVAGSAADCPFYNPAVLVATAVLPAIAIKLAEFSSRPRPTLSKVVVACP